MNLLAYDEQLFRQVNGLAGHSPALDYLGVFAAEWLIWLMVVSLLLLSLLPLWQHRRGTCDLVSAVPNLRDRRAPGSLRAAHAAVTALLASLLALVGNQLFSWLVLWRDRPYAVLADAVRLIPEPITAKSLPSDHATVAFALAISLTLVRPRFGVFLLLAAAMVAWGRVFAGVHFPGDVLAGAAAGALWAGVAYGLERRFNLMRRIGHLYERACRRLTT
jgi:undecaprenyl-diphosphatase